MQIEYKCRLNAATVCHMKTLQHEAKLKHLFSHTLIMTIIMWKSVNWTRTSYAQICSTSVRPYKCIHIQNCLFIDHLCLKNTLSRPAPANPEHQPAFSHQVRSSSSHGCLPISQLDLKPASHQLSSLVWELDPESVCQKYASVLGRFGKKTVKAMQGLSK